MDIFAYAKRSEIAAIQNEQFQIFLNYNIENSKDFYIGYEIEKSNDYSIFSPKLRTPIKRNFSGKKFDGATKVDVKETMKIYKELLLCKSNCFDMFVLSLFSEITDCKNLDFEKVWEIIISPENDIFWQIYKPIPNGIQNKSQTKKLARRIFFNYYKNQKSLSQSKDSDFAGEKIDLKKQIELLRSISRFNFTRENMLEAENILEAHSSFKEKLYNMSESEKAFLGFAHEKEIILIADLENSLLSFIKSCKNHFSRFIRNRKLSGENVSSETNEKFIEELFGDEKIEGAKNKYAPETTGSPIGDLGKKYQAQPEKSNMCPIDFSKIPITGLITYK